MCYDYLFDFLLFLIPRAIFSTALSLLGTAILIRELAVVKKEKGSATNASPVLFISVTFSAFYYCTLQYRGRTVA